MQLRIRCKEFNDLRWPLETMSRILYVAWWKRCLQFRLKYWKTVLISQTSHWWTIKKLHDVIYVTIAKKGREWHIGTAILPPSAILEYHHRLGITSRGGKPSCFCPCLFLCSAYPPYVLYVTVHSSFSPLSVLCHQLVNQTHLLLSVWVLKRLRPHNGSYHARWK